jgi:hypothetical protein
MTLPNSWGLGTSWGIAALAISFCITPGLAAAVSASSNPADACPLAGSWELTAADVLHPDGTRGRDFGVAPKGRLLVDGQGRYSLQIFKSERPRFASDDKQKGSIDELTAAVMGSSTHFGTIVVDGTAHTLTFDIAGASFPNWEGTSQRRQFELRGDELSYQVQKRPDGNIPISVWRRIR